MKKLLYVSIPFLMLGCGTSEDSLKVETNQDSTLVISDTALTFKDSLQIDLPLTDSAIPIIHGSPDQEKLDSIKNSKKDKKKNG